MLLIVSDWATLNFRVKYLTFDLVGSSAVYDVILNFNGKFMEYILVEYLLYVPWICQDQDFVSVKAALV
jgi:hypothetical protein